MKSKNLTLMLQSNTIWPAVEQRKTTIHLKENLAKISLFHSDLFLLRVNIYTRGVQDCRKAIPRIRIVTVQIRDCCSKHISNSQHSSRNVFLLQIIYIMNKYEVH